MLPANEGDALWVEYGDPAAPFRILIDCGYKNTYQAVRARLKQDAGLKFELFVLTHIDADHIAGAVPLVFDPLFTRERVGDIWFNGYKHLSDVMGVEQAEFFTHALKEKRLPWNEAFKGNAALADPTAEPILLAGGMKITLLSPYRAQLRNLLRDWDKELERILKASHAETLEEHLSRIPARLQPDVLGKPDVAELAGRPFETDTKSPNGSSIAFLAEYNDAGTEKRVLFTGDAFPGVLEKSLDELLRKRGASRLRLDALKVSHHGSRKNTSSSLLSRLNTQNYLISTNGSRSHHHPDDECIARLVHAQKNKVKLWFNYKSDYNKDWGNSRLEKKHNYAACYPDQPGFLTVPL
jgi:beta-lactamase superfamily II metal-dependent hydrolase